MPHLGLIARIESLVSQGTVRIWVRGLSNNSAAAHISNSVTGAIVSCDIQQGLVEFLVQGAPTGFSDIDNQTLYIPMDEIFLLSK